MPTIIDYSHVVLNLTRMLHLRSLNSFVGSIPRSIINIHFVYLEKGVTNHIWTSPNILDICLLRLFGSALVTNLFNIKVWVSYWLCLIKWTVAQEYWLGNPLFLTLQRLPTESRAHLLATLKKIYTLCMAYCLGKSSSSNAVNQHIPLGVKMISMIP